MRHSTTGIIALAALLMATSPLAAANLVVPTLELASDGALNEDELFEVRSRLALDLAIQGGTKFAAVLRLELLADELERILGAQSYELDPLTATTDELAEALNEANLRSKAFLGFRSIALSIPDAFGLPLETTYFAGRFDALASGADYPALFGSADVSTTMKGYMAFPNGIGGARWRWYEGIHEVSGTGLRLGLRAADGNAAAYLYAYQDAGLGPGRWSLDARGMLMLDSIKLEAFIGGSGPESGAGVYRGGLLFHFDTGSVGEFYAQLGVPYWDPTESFQVENLYFLFEPRVRLGVGTVILTLFYHPAWYLQSETTEGGMLDANFNLRFGDASGGAARGGVETRVSFDPGYVSIIPALERPTGVTVDVAPYIAFSAGGIEWNFRLPVRAFPFEGPWYSIFAPVVAAKASF